MKQNLWSEIRGRLFSVDSVVVWGGKVDLGCLGWMIQYRGNINPMDLCVPEMTLKPLFLLKLLTLSDSLLVGANFGEAKRLTIYLGEMMMMTTTLRSGRTGL